MSHLDAPVVRLMFAQFVDPYEENCYWWQTLEIMRKLCMTGMLILVRLLTDDSEVSTVAVGIAVCVFSIIVHLKYSPFHCDKCDTLQLLFLIAQFMLYLRVMTMLAAASSGPSFVDYILLLTNLVVVALAVSFILPAYKMVFIKLQIRATSTLGHYKKRLSENLEKRGMFI